MKFKFIAIVFLFISGFSFSQEQEDVKVGLVLSGGGAKGLAHIGALKVIEEAGVRIDYIGGTSMGAIVGALYASGYSANELDSIFGVVDFDKLIQDDIPRAAKTFYEKNDSEKYALTLPFKKFKITLPSSLSQGQNFFNLISRLTSHVSHIHDFSKLPIPFFCMATNVETGSSVKLDRGYLPQAVSASGALPSLFSPIEIEGNLLIDGGVTNNYPVDELREMGAEIIIGIDVQDSLMSRDQLESAVELLLQINNFRTIKAMKEKRKKTDIYIHPDIVNFSVISFDKGEEIITAGETEALNYYIELKALAQRQKQTPKLTIEKKQSDTIEINSVSMSGNEDYTRSYVLGKLKLNPPVKVTYAQFNEGINNLSATGNFSQINYFFEDTEQNQKNLELQLKENNVRSLFRLGIHYDDLYKSAALINFTRKRLFQKNDVASFDLILGDNIRYNFDYYIDKGYYLSVGVNSRFNKFKKNVKFSLIPPELVDTNETVANIELQFEDFTNQFYLQTLFKQIYSIGFGAEHKHLVFETKTLISDIEDEPTVFEDSSYYSAFGYLKVDSRDNKYFPKKGILFDGRFNFYAFASGFNKNFEPFSITKATLNYTFSPTKKLSLTLGSEGGFKIEGEDTRSLDFFLGGYGYQAVNNFIHLFGYDALSLRGDTYLKSSLRADYLILKKTYLSAVANIANVGDKLFETSAWIDSIPYQGYALGCATESIIGPVELFYSYSPEIKQSQWYVSLGFWF